jgi:IS30 family transposase
MAAHFTIAERQLLHRLLQRKLSMAEIAVLLNRHRSTVYRELDRNSSAFGYRPKHAQHLRDQRRKACGRRSKFSDLRTRLYVTEHLMQAWSPDQIAGRLRRDFPLHPERHLTAQAIYDWLQTSPLWRRRWLRHGTPRLEKSRKKPAEVRIRGRPAVINRRCRYGDWEGDTIVGKRRRNGLVTLLERKSGLVKIDKVNDLCSETAMRACQRCLAGLPRSLRRSVTFDNGPEFTDYYLLSHKPGLAVYFADPYSAWQRGANENVNGLIRQYFPKGTDFAHVPRREAKRVERLLNDRPRRRFDYRTPLEVLRGTRCRI